MMASQPQPDSALLQLPVEIRDQVWQLVFFDCHVTPPPLGPRLALDGCLACVNIACENEASGSSSTSEYPTWQEAFSPLRTCKQIFNEAHKYFMSSFTLHLGTPLGDPMRAIVPYLASIRDSVRRLEWRVHILEDNRVDWIASIGIIGNLFPNLEKVIIHAHMRPPDRYEKLIDAIYVALPMVRLGEREMPSIQLDIDLGYMSDGVMFNSPFIGAVTTEDALEEHALVIKDLIADEEFIELALAEDLDIHAMISALLRIASAHERAWYEKLQAKRMSLPS